MPNIIQTMMQKMVMGQLEQLPEMQQARQMLQGKTPQQQWETVCNFAKSQKIDLNQKILSRGDLESLGLRLANKG
jgi:hypothetical protein